MNLLLTLLYCEFIIHIIKNHLILNEYQKIIYSEEGYGNTKYAKKHGNTEKHRKIDFASKRNRF